MDGPCFMAVRDNINGAADRRCRQSKRPSGQIRVLGFRLPSRTQGVKVRIHPLVVPIPSARYAISGNIALNDVKTWTPPEQHRCCFIAKREVSPRPRD